MATEWVEVEPGVAVEAKRPAAKWITVAPGIRCREHPTRRHGVRPDRYFTLRISINGRRVEEALGWASEGWTLKRAQEELGKLRAAARTGEGPTTLREQAEAKRRAERQKAEEEAVRRRHQKAVADLWDRYSKEVVAVKNKPRTAAEKTRMWKRRIEPAIGILRIKDVTDEDAGAVVRAPLRLDDTGHIIGGKAEAGNLYRLLHHMFHKALVWGLRPKELGNPLDPIDEPKVQRRKRLLTAREIGALLRALDTAKREQTEAPQTIAAIRAAILTGARISELLDLEWDHIRRDEMQLHLYDTKTDFSCRPLSLETLAVLDGVERMPGVPFVFRAVTDPEKPLSYNTTENAFQRIAARAGVKNCTLHTLRHWFATTTANSVKNPRVGMALTGHKSLAAYMNYVHSDEEQARALADQLAALANGFAKTEPNVAPLQKRKDG
jgi:integrase